jgi:hypothetical protein
LKDVLLDVHFLHRYKTVFFITRNEFWL